MGDVRDSTVGSGRTYDLEERTAVFGETIIELAKMVRRDEVTRSLVDQMVRAGTSIGANYLEANDCESRKDFRHKISLCRKEARETKHWLRMLGNAQPDLADRARPVWQEAKELNLIFAAIVRKLDSK